MAEGPGAIGGWRFEDDRGTVLECDEPPRRVVAYVRAAVSLWEGGARPVGVFGSQHDVGSSLQHKAGPMDLSSLTVLGCGGEVDLDRYARLAPDLLVGVGYGGAFYGVPPEQAARMAELAPTACVEVGPGTSYPALVERFTALAGSLRGPRPAGLADPVVDARARFDAAVARLRRTAGSAPVLAVSGADEERVHVANPAAWPELAYLADLGVAMVTPDVKPGGGWATLAWSDLKSVDAAVVLYDTRANALDAEQLAGTSGWTALPAVAAGRTVAWNPELPCAYGSGADFLTDVAAVLGRLG